MMKIFEGRTKKWFGEYVSKLMFGINPLDLNVTMSDMGAKAMVLDANVVSSGMKMGGVYQFNASFVIFKMVE